MTNSTKICLKKSAITAMYGALFFLLSLNSAYAESLFLKDGSISEGSIVTETDKVVKYKFGDGKISEIPRKDILRILHHTDFNLKRYLYKTDNSMVEAYIVDENKTAYTYRVDLNSAEEFIVLKSEIETISKKKIEFASDKKEKVMTREENIVTRASRWRFGGSIGGPFDATADYSEKALFIRGINIDLFPYRMRDANGNGLDILIRGSVNASKTDEQDMIKLGYTPKNDPTLTFDYSEIFQMALGCGLRYINGWYVGGMLLQGYLLGYYQYSNTKYMIAYQGSPTLPGEYDNNLDQSYNSHGFVGGAGIEVALFSYFGIFGEYTNGYSKAFPSGKNSEAGVFRFGVTLRTSYL